MSWTSPRTWVAAETVTAALLNTHVRDNLNALRTPVSFTPSWTNVTVGNGTNTGSYVTTGSGGLVFFQASLTFGTTSSVSAGIQLTLPVTASAFGGGPSIQSTAFDFSASQFYSGAAINVSTTLVTITNLASPLAAWGTTSPMTWATSDIIAITGWYLAS